jgi:hypothetical protein
MATAETVFYCAICPLALAWCGVLAWEIVRELRRARARTGAPETRKGAFSTRRGAWPSLVSLLALSGALEAAR